MDDEADQLALGDKAAAVDCKTYDFSKLDALLKSYVEDPDSKCLKDYVKDNPGFIDAVHNFNLAAEQTKLDIDAGILDLATKDAPMMVSAFKTFVGQQNSFTAGESAEEDQNQDVILLRAGCQSPRPALNQQQ